MTKTAYRLDFKDFNKKYGIIMKKTIPEAIEKGLFEAISALKIDADNEPPRTPHLGGDLRAEYEIKTFLKELMAELTYEMPYAHRWHEAEPGTVIWSEADQGVGPKYVETKMARHKDSYMGVVAESIRTKSR